jgi:GNAT superfamily N-acetyltransferase
VGLVHARAAQGRGLVLLAELDGRAVGLLTGDVRERLNHQTPEVWLADLVVADAARGRGVGKALLERALAFARGIGAHRIALESGHWRKDAHRFYAREGSEDLGLHLSRRP